MYEMLMTDEHRTQHVIHKQQLDALDEMWKGRIEKVVEDTRAREEDLMSEITRLRMRCQQEVAERHKERITFAEELKKFLVNCQHNGYTSVPLMLQKIAELTNGLVDQATETPVGTSTPLPPLTVPTSSRKRVLGTDDSKYAQFARTPAVKRTLDMDEGVDPIACRMRIE